MRVAVMAAGAVGGYFGGRMAAAGHDVVFIARGAHGGAVRRAGLKIESALGDLHLKNVNVTDDPSSVAGFPPMMKASMANDLHAGNRLELDWLAGWAARVGFAVCCWTTCRASSVRHALGCAGNRGKANNSGYSNRVCSGGGISRVGIALITIQRTSLQAEGARRCVAGAQRPGATAETRIAGSGSTAP
jgi:hypothetical protein